MKKFLQPLRKDKKVFAIGTIRSLFFGIEGGIAALMVKDMINALQNHDVNGFLWALIIMGIFRLLTVIPNYFFRNNQERFFRGLEGDFYNTYITKYLQLENNISDSLGTGYFNNVIQKGGDNRFHLLSNINGSGLQVIIRIITAMILFIIYTGWIGFLIVIIFFSISFAIAQHGNKKMSEVRKEMRDLFTQSDRDIIRLIMSKFEVLSHNKTSFELHKLSNLFDGITSRKYYESYLKIFTFDMQKGGIFVLQIILVIYIAYGILNGQYELGIISMAWMLSNQINGSVQDFNDYISQFYSQIIYVEKLRETFDDAPVIQGYDTGKEFFYKKGNISLNDITYDYGKGEVLKNFSLKIQGGKKTAFVGISGSGKSTLIKLIAGYIHPQEGVVQVDSQELPNAKNHDYVSLQSYYQHIGYLTQEPNVFDGTIYDNLTYALESEKIDFHKLEEIIDAAQCKFIYEFPDGLQTYIGEKGIKLSGGQRQRLAIAKVMLKNPQIILLDEPTSALDSFSEEEVTKALHNLFIGKTVIVIAHRLQTVKQADEIIVLESGKIVERGNHNELVKHGGQYAKMLELQSGF